MRQTLVTVSLFAMICGAGPSIAQGQGQATGQGTGTEGPSGQTPSPQQELGKNPKALEPTVNKVTESASKPTIPAFAQKSDNETAGQWTSPGHNTALTRYSALDEINRDNVKTLQVAATFSVGTNRGQESSPIVVGDTLYLVSSFPNILYALDLTKPGFPMKWSYDPKSEIASQGVACCDLVNRGPTYADGKILYNTLDNFTVAVDAKSGSEVWRTKNGDINQGETMTMAPLVAGDKVIVGNSGGELGVRGWAKALDLKSGKEVWRAHTTGPDADVKIGPDYKPFYDQEKGKDLGVTSWPADMWRQGGGSVWGWVSYDPELRLVYYGTSNPGPWNHEQRPGDNKFTAGVFARDVDTGNARWYYQYSPHDYYDHDGVNEHVLLDIEWKGKPRKALVHPDRNGHVYLMDRQTGEVLSAGTYHYTNTNFGVDLKTGQLKHNTDKAPKVDTVTRDICPSPPGAKDWSPSSYSPKTGFLYLPHNNLCMDERLSQVGYIEGTPYVGADVNMKPGPGGHRGEFTAWNVTDGSEAWTIKETFPVWGGAAATAGNVVFYGTMDGWFKAVDANTGKELWKFKTGSGIIGQPTIWKGPDGHQYVSIIDGVGGWSGAIVSGGLDPREGTAALGFVAAMRDLPKVTTAGGTLYVLSFPRLRPRVLAVAVLALAGSGTAGARELRVCADPNNLPFSNKAGEGFENRIAEIVARDLGATLTYTWWAQRRGFLRNTLNAGLCDVVPGLPVGTELARPTTPLYRSGYAFVQPMGAEPITSFDDARLKDMRIGVQMVGDDGYNTPPAHALSRRGIVASVRGYGVYGDYSQPHPPSRIVDAVAKGEVDVAVVWGPLAGYFAAKADPPLRVTLVRPPFDGARLPLAFDIAFSVRRDDDDGAFAREIGGALRRHRAEVDAILADYAVPRLDEPRSPEVQ